MSELFLLKMVESMLTFKEAQSHQELYAVNIQILTFKQSLDLLLCWVCLFVHTALNGGGFFRALEYIKQQIDRRFETKQSNG